MDYLLFKNPPKDIVIDLRERERDRQTDRHHSIAFLRTLIGNQTHNLLVYRMMLQSAEPPGQGCFVFFI